jgi:hypothetical protein
MTITAVRYFYYRDDKRAPRITLCAVRADDWRVGYGWAICDWRVGYGWAICSASDPVHKDDWLEWIDDGRTNNAQAFVRRVGGKTLARGRAEAALTKRGRGFQCLNWQPHVWRYARPVRRKEAQDVMAQCDYEQMKGFLRLVKEGDVRGLPKALRPEAFLERFAAPIPHEMESIDADTSEQ